MDNIEFFKFDWQEMTDTLCNKLEGMPHELSEAESREVDLGLFFLSSVVDLLPVQVSGMVTACSSKCDNEDAGDFLIELAAVSKNIDERFLGRDWADLEACLLEMTQANEMNTTLFLGVVFFWLQQGNNRQLPDAVFCRVRQLLAKYEVFGRIFNIYDRDCRRIDDDFGCLCNYALLGLVLLALYGRRNIIEYLNTALKLMDMLLAVSPSSEKMFDRFVTLAVVVRARAELEKFYESEEFCMSCG